MNFSIKKMKNDGWRGKKRIWSFSLSLSLFFSFNKGPPSKISGLSVFQALALFLLLASYYLLI
jgi:hypothetical protein